MSSGPAGRTLPGWAPRRASGREREPDGSDCLAGPGDPDRPTQHGDDLGRPFPAAFPATPVGVWRTMGSHDDGSLEASSWSQPPRTFAECNFRLVRERRKAAQPKLPQGPWRPPSRHTRLRTPLATAAGEVAPSPRPPLRARTARAVPRHGSIQMQPAAPPSISKRSGLWAAGLTSREAAELRSVTAAVPHQSNRRTTPAAAAVALRLSARQKQERQVRQIGKVLRGMIASRRSVSGKPMAGALVSAFEAIDHDGCGRVSSEEFSRAMLRLGMGLTSKQLEQLIQVLDVDGDGALSLPEFVSIVTEPPQALPPATSRPRHSRRDRNAKQAGPVADAAMLEALRCAATEVLLGHAAIDACRTCWDPSSALQAIHLADVGAGAVLAAAVR